MGASDQGRALEYALAHNYTALYTALESVAHKSAAISLGGFQSAVLAADDRYYGIDSSERAALCSAFGRLSRADQEQARVWVLTQNYQSLFAQLEGVRGHAKAGKATPSRSRRSPIRRRTPPPMWAPPRPTQRSPSLRSPKI